MLDVEQVQRIDLAAADRLKGWHTSADGDELNRIHTDPGLLKNGLGHRHVAPRQTADADFLLREIFDGIDTATVQDNDFPNRVTHRIVDVPDLEVRLVRLAR